MNSSSFLILTLQLILVVLSSSRTWAIPNPNAELGETEEGATEGLFSLEDTTAAGLTDEPPLSTEQPPISGTSSELPSEEPSTTADPNGFPQEDENPNFEYNGGPSEEEETLGGQASSEERMGFSESSSQSSRLPPSNPDNDDMTDTDDMSGGDDMTDRDDMSGGDDMTDRDDFSDQNSEEFAFSPTARPSRVVPPNDVSRPVQTNGDIPPFPPLSSSPKRSRPSISHQTTASQFEWERQRNHQPARAIGSLHTISPQLPAIKSFSAIPAYHPETPTRLIVEFAELRRVFNNRMKVMTNRTNEVDDRVTSLLKGNLTAISAVRKANTESIKKETGLRREGLKRVQRQAYNWVEAAKNELEQVHANLDLIRQSVNLNSAQQNNYLQAYVLHADQNIRQLTQEMGFLFSVVDQLQKIKNEKTKDQR